MRISRASVHNFRSIKDLELYCGPTTVLIGPNNHGKSNVLAALDFFFSSGKPLPSDVFQHCGDDRNIWVDVTFSELSTQEKKTFEKYLGPGGTLRIRKTATFDEALVKVEVGYRGWLSQPKVDWLRSSSAGTFKKRDDLPSELASLVPASRISKSIVEEAQQRYIEANKDAIEFEEGWEDGPLLGQKNVAAGVLPDAYLVPAVRDLSQDTATKGNSLFARLLSRAVAEMTAADPEFQRLKEELKAAVAKLNRDGETDTRPAQLRGLESAIEKELKDWNVRLDIRIEPPEIDKVLELGTSLQVNDGVLTSAESKGHGLQRAIIVALTRAWALALRGQGDGDDQDPAARGRSESVILMVEEPELFLHPQAQRRLDRSLREIGSSANHQVIICTHAPVFVRMDDYRSIAMLYKVSTEQGTITRQCTKDLFAGEDNASRKKQFNMAHWVNPDRAELFFARRVAFVEGATESVLLPFLAERLGCADPEVSVIDCGSKFNLALYMEIAGAFGLKHVVIHDEDPVDEGLTDDKLKQAKKTFALNAEIATLGASTRSEVHVLSPDFERVAGVSKNQGEKKGKPLAALDWFTEHEAVPEPLAEVVRAVYGTSG